MDLSFINGSHFLLITLYAIHIWHMTSKTSNLHEEVEMLEKEARKHMVDAREKDEIITETLQKIDYKLGSEAIERNKNK